MLEFTKQIVQLLVDYVSKNRLDFDKTTFFTIVIGQITIYGILLTFYQFVASYKGNENGVTRYLGVNITEHFVKKNISVFDKIVSRKWFGTVFVLEILYKPFLTIYREMISAQMISVMNFIWIVFVIFYFVIFVILFFQCTKCILMIKLCSDAKTNGSIIRDINRMFLKKTVKARIGQKTVDLLKEDFKCLGHAIKVDDNPDLQERYNHLIYNILKIYIEHKTNEISKIEKKRVISKNQVPWMYNADCEIHLLQEILDEKYFSLDKSNIKFIFSFHMKLLELNLKRAQLEGYQKISFAKYRSLHIKMEEKVFDANEWIDVTLNIYRNLNDEMKMDVIHSLQLYSLQSQNLYKVFGDECVFELIKIEVENIFCRERKQADFVNIFSWIIKEERFNNFYADIIRDKLIYYNQFDAREILGQLNKNNCVYLFSYMIMYYSIYKFRFDWKYINISVLKTLWNGIYDIKDDTKEIIERIKKSNIGHRFTDEMYISFLEYIEANFNSDLLNKIQKDKILDVFYCFVIKMCVINHGNLIYLMDDDNVNIDIYTMIFNELSKHDELIENEKILKWIYDMRYCHFMKQDHFPKNLDITLRNLLLTNINIMAVIKYINEKHYYDTDCFGAYLLVNVQELSDEIQKQERIKGVVRTAFIASNMNVDEYIDMLEKECCICKHKIDYVQKEKMKEYLIKTF